MPSSDPSLLLLPPPSNPLDHASINKAYRLSLERAISHLKVNKDGTTLLVAVCSPVLNGSSPREKTLSWNQAQSLLAGLYSVISVVCAKLSIPLQVRAGPGSVDVRVVLVDCSLDSALPVTPTAGTNPNNTIVTDLATFCSAYLSWNFIFHPGDIDFYGKIEQTLKALKYQQIIAVQDANRNSAASSNVGRPAQSQSQSQSDSSGGTQSIVCLGGTFDHLHPGHKLLLTAAVLLLNVPSSGASQPCQFIVGITGDELLKRKKNPEFVQSWEERAMNVIEFLTSVLYLGASDPVLTKKDGEITAFYRNKTIAISCVVIQDAFGPTVTQEPMDALVVSGETKSGGEMVNNRRQELGWHTLNIFEVDVLDAQEIGDPSAANPSKTENNFAFKISSTAIRKQKADSRI